MAVQCVSPAKVILLSARLKRQCQMAIMEKEESMDAKMCQRCWRDDVPT